MLYRFLRQSAQPFFFYTEYYSQFGFKKCEGTKTLIKRFALYCGIPFNSFGAKVVKEVESVKLIFVIT